MIENPCVAGSIPALPNTPKHPENTMDIAKSCNVQSCAENGPDGPCKANTDLTGSGAPCGNLVGEKKPYEWDFDGACAPSGRSAWNSQTTFSLGIFQWLPRSNGEGLKRGKVVQRVKGFMGKPDNAIQRARQIVAEKNAAKCPLPNAKGKENNGREAD